MAMTLQEIRKKYPAYDDLSDIELADKIHSKFYADLPREDVYRKLELSNASTDYKPMELEVTKNAASDKPDWRGLAGDTIRMLGNALKGGIGLVRSAPKNLKEIGSELIDHPLSYPPHVAQQVLAGLVGGTRDVANLPHKFFDELADRHITPNWLRTGSIPEDTGLEKAVGFQPTKKSDELLRALPALYGGGKLVTPVVKKAKKVATAPSKEALFQRALNARIEEATDKIGMSKKDLESLKESLRRDYSKIHQEKLGDVTPIGQEEAINVKKGKLEKLKPLTEIPEQLVGDIPPEPDTKSIIEEKKSTAEQARQSAEKALGVLDNPRLKGGQIVQNAIKDVKKSSSDLYDAARKHYVDKQILADNSKEIKAITSDLEELKAADELAPGYGSGTDEQKTLEAQISALKSETVNASDIFDLQRTLEKMAQDTRKKQYSGVNEIEFKRLGSLAERLDKHASKLATRLEAVGGKDVQSMIKEANKGWATYKDLERNNVGKAALNKGELPSRAMIDIANTQPGNEFLRSLTDAYPELKRHMLAAHVGESNVNKLLKPNTLTKKYLEALPEVEDKVIALKEAIAGIKHGETKAANVKAEYDALVNSMKNAAKEQKARKDAIEASEKLKQQIKFHEDAIPKIREKMQVLDKHTAEHAKLQKELSEHKKHLADKNHLLKKYGNMLLKVTGLSTLGHKIGL